jgi:hypothetical protein
MLCKHDNVAPCVECDIEPLEKENKELRQQLDACKPSSVLADDAKHQLIIIQAQIWAQEARTQKAIVMEIGKLVGCNNDWEMIEAVKAALATTVVLSGVWQFYQDGEWNTGMNTLNHRANTEAEFIVRDLWVKQEQES